MIINDLYSLVLPRLEELQQPRNVHFQSAGDEVMARAVAEHILHGLKTEQGTDPVVRTLPGNNFADTENT